MVQNRNDMRIRVIIKRKNMDESFEPIIDGLIENEFGPNGELLHKPPRDDVQLGQTPTDDLSEDHPAWNYYLNDDLEDESSVEQEDEPTIQEQGDVVARRGLVSKKNTRSVDKFDIILFGT